MKVEMYYALVAGLLFGGWPLVMNRSGLSGYASAAIFAGLAFLTVLPFAGAKGAVEEVLQTPANGLTFAFIAAFMGGLGLIAFNTMLAKSDPKEVGLMLIFMIMVQMALPAVSYMVQAGELSPRKLSGIALAFVAAKLLF